MILIDMPMPRDCGSCPCSYFTEGAFSDICELTEKEVTLDEKRDDCPLREVEEPRDDVRWAWGID